MRIFPIALIAIGLFGVARYFGLIPIGTFHLMGPLLLIALGVALFFRPTRGCRGNRGVRNRAVSTNAP